MTTAQALKLAREKWGRRAEVRDGGKRFRDGTKRPTATERAQMQAELPAHRAAKPPRPDVATFGDERTIAEYREALAVWDRACRGWKEREEYLRGNLLASRRFAVGSIMEVLGAFHVRGEGDTWEEAFAKAETANETPNRERRVSA